MNPIFEDTATAFALKSDSELERAYFVFKLIANKPLVRIGAAITNFAITVRLPLESLIRATIFDHFCGGVDEEDCITIIDEMYGMNDHINFNIADKGYNVTKYLPYGSVRDVIPYLIRRAKENTSVAGRSSRELDLLKREKNAENINLWCKGFHYNAIWTVLE